MSAGLAGGPAPRLRQAQNDLEFGRLALRETAGVLDSYSVATRYPNGLAGGVPFESFGERQAHEPIEGAERFVAIAREALPQR